MGTYESLSVYNMFIVIILFSRIIFIFLSRPSLTLQNVRITLAPQRNPDRGRSSLESHYESENWAGGRSRVRLVRYL